MFIQCVAKYAGLLIPATPATSADFEVTFRLPTSGPCSVLSYVCLPGNGGQCQASQRAAAVSPQLTALNC